MAVYWATFVEVIVAPFRVPALVWGIVPLYFALVLGELTSAKANFRTAIQTGFSFLWAAAQWVYPYFQVHGPDGPRVEWNAMQPIKLLLTAAVIALGTAALISGISRKYPKYCSFLGYTRFSNYFMITMFPMQAGFLRWTWNELIAIALFAVPIWAFLHFGLMPLRGGK